MGCDKHSEEDFRAMVLPLRTYQYQNHRAKGVLAYISNPEGLICERSIKRELVEKQCFDLDDERDNKSKYDPEQMFKGLSRYLEDRDYSFEETAWNAAYAATLKAFTLPYKLKQEKSYAFLKLAIKDEKASGAPDFQDKGVVFDKDYKRMENWLKGSYAPQPCVAQHRVQHGPEGPKSRLVWAYPQMVTLAEASFARPLIDAFVPRRSVMAMGKHRHKLSAMMTPMMNAHVKYGLDMSRFDASPCRKLVNMAFNILCHNFDWSCSSLTDWEKVRHYFVHTPIIMPDGFVYTKHKGIPSGSYFTQLIDSVINHFVIQYVYYTLTGNTIFLDRILVLGDDSLFSSPVSLNLERFARELKKIGFTMNPDKSCAVFDNGDIEFLGHKWKRGLVDRDPIEVAKRMAYPERHSSEKDPRRRIRSRIYPYISDALCAHEIISNYQKVRTNNIVARYANVDIIWKEHKTGWKSHLDTVNYEPLINNDTLIQAYIGILR